MRALSGGRPVWFRTGEQPLFGWFCAPDDGSARGVVVVCNPLGAECDNAQVAFEALAEDLVARGMAVLRFDYDGTGDSAGAWSDPDRLGAWTASIQAALEFGRSAVNGPLAVVGMRMGALLALDALGKADPGGGSDGPRALVLWDPCIDGRRFLREQALLLSAAYGEGQPGGGAAEGPATYYEPETAAALSTFDPLTDATPPAPSVLVLTREGRSLGASLSALVEDDRVDWSTVAGQADLLDVPGVSTVDAADVAKVAAWVDGQVDAHRHPVTVSLPARARVSTSSGEEVDEEFVDLGEVPLFGIRCRPADGGDRPLAVFLTAGVLHRSGPARMWTDLARRWAARGLPSVRLDLSGIGFSGNRPGQQRQVVVAPEALDDLTSIAEALGAPDGRGLVYVGLSSGGYLAVEAALQQHPLGICPVNPSITIPPAEGISQGTRRRAHRPPLFRSLRRSHRRIAGHLAWATGQVLVRRAPVGALVGAARRGSSVCTVVTGDEAEPLRRNAFWGLMAWRVRRAGRYRLCIIPGHDHSLYLRATRDVAMEVMTEWLIELRDREPGGPE